MKIDVAFRYRRVKEDHGTWGNKTPEDLVERHPWLRSLVAELYGERDWSWSHDQTSDGWRAFFFEDKVAGETTVSLEMKPSRKTLRVPSLTLQADPLVTLRDVERWIISGIHRAP